MSTKYGVTAIGNAIVDILAPASDDLIRSQEAFGMRRGHMTLINAERAADIYKLMGPATEMSGGSAANTMAAYASLGGKGAFIGKVANDQFGKVFTHDMNAIGIDFDTPPMVGGLPTAQCLILVTSDAARTMNTFLGTSTKFKPEDVNEDLIANSDITYLEGYLFDDVPAKEAFFKAADMVRKHGKRLALTLSDPFCVVRHRDDFKRLISIADILLANHNEAIELTGISDADKAIEALRGMCDTIAITMGEKGSRIMRGNETYNIAPVAPPQLVDTTGAGDAYAAGFLFGLTEGKDLATCGHYGSVAASEVISHMGPRPLKKLRELIA